MEYIGIAVGIILFLLGVKMMATGGSSSKQDHTDYNSMYQQPYHHRLNYDNKAEPENMMYFYGKMLTVIGSVFVLIMILLLTGIF